jgi:hypothetical protein
MVESEHLPGRRRRTLDEAEDYPEQKTPSALRGIYFETVAVEENWQQADLNLICQNQGSYY